MILYKTHHLNETISLFHHLRSNFKYITFSFMSCWNRCELFILKLRFRILVFPFFSMNRKQKKLKLRTYKIYAQKLDIVIRYTRQYKKKKLKICCEIAMICLNQKRSLCNYQSLSFSTEDLIGIDLFFPSIIKFLWFNRNFIYYFSFTFLNTA